MQVSSKTALQTFRSYGWRTPRPQVVIHCGVLVMSCSSFPYSCALCIESCRADFDSYDRMSPSFQKYMETLTATCAQPVFKSACEAGGYEGMSPRGSPLNKDYEFAPVHPVVRTHPVTGWKSLFAGVGLHVSRINDVYTYEDPMIRDSVLRLITRNHH